MRAPAVPLIVHDPFFSIWSPADRLTDIWPTHWSGRVQPLSGLVRIDGHPMRWMGDNTVLCAPLEAMEQTALSVTPTRSLYRFEARGVALDVTFVTPAIPDDLDVMARPITYVSVAVSCTDGAAHRVQIYLDIAASVCLDQTEANVIWGRHLDGAVSSLWAGAVDQQVLGRGGDEILIDWGYLHLSPEPGRETRACIGEGASLRRAFAADGTIPERDGYAEGADLSMPTKSAGGEIYGKGTHRNLRPPFVALALAADLGASDAPRNWSAAVGYDQVFAAEYRHRRLRPWWRRTHASMIGLLGTAWAERAALEARCAALDAEVTGAMRAQGGQVLADLSALAWRQCLGGHILVADLDGTPLHFSKETSSNGCMGTVDLTYPAAPFFLLHAPELLEAQLRFILDYAAGPEWPFAFAPHDIGRFPLGNGQVYGGCNTSTVNQMPYEECGNMLILSAALVARTGGAALRPSDWPTLRTWGDYLVGVGFDPDEQLSTDDFDGHMAHNANLSVKATIALGAAAQLARHYADAEAAETFEAAAQRGAAAFLATPRTADHYPKRFDEPASWSLKYNLVWDRILGTGLFPSEMIAAELRKYREQARPFGTPLYSDTTHTKLDWLVWAACLADGREERDALLAPIAHWLSQTLERVPLCDWYDTETGGFPRIRGFRGRPVVGGVFMPLLMAETRARDR